MAKPKFIYKMASYLPHGASLVAQTVKNLPANAGEVSLISGLERSPEEGHNNPLQFSCLENPMDGGAW